MCKTTVLAHMLETRLGQDLHSCVNAGGKGRAGACEFHNVFNVQFQTAWDHKSSGPCFLKKHLPCDCQGSNGSGYYINHFEL